MRVFTEQLAAAFERQGVATLTLDLAQVQFTDVLRVAREEQPDMTCCFNGVLPDEQRGFLCEFLDIPHFAWILDPPYEFLPLKDSPYNLIGVVDASYRALYSALGCDNCLFLPHGTDPQVSDEMEKIYEVALIGTCLDANVQEAQWKELLPANAVKLLYRAAESVKADADTTPLDALCREAGVSLAEMETAVAHDIPLIQLWVQLERYLRGRDRLDLIDAIDDADLHLFGRGWKEAVGDLKGNIHIHPAVDYPQAMQVMAQSKILINSVPVFKHGGHERIFTGPCQGAAVMANESAYLQENFEPGVDILTYSLSDKSGVNALLKEYLGDEVKRQALVRAAREKILKDHSWDARVKTLQSRLSLSP